MVLKIQVEFSTPISIQGNAKNSMFILLEPYLDTETTDDVPDFAAGELDAANNGFKASTTHLGQTLTNVFETNPTNVEVNGKYLKLTLNSYFDDIYKYLKTFHFFYDEQEENGKILRGDVAESLSQSTKLAVSNSTGLVEQTQQGGALEPKDKFEFKIEKILIKDEEPDKIFYFYTSNRTLKIENVASGQAINAVNGIFTLNVNQFLDQTFTNDNEYYSNANANSGTAFTIDNTAGVTIGQNTEGKFFSVQRDSTSGRLTKNSGFQSASIQLGTYNTTDEFGFPLEIDLTNHTEVDNKIKNPTLHAEIIPSIGGEGYIAIKMSKDSGASFLNMVGVTKDENDNITNIDSDRTIRHGGADNDGATTHPLASNNDLIVSAGNAYNGLTTLDFNFKGTGTEEIANIVTGDELKVKIDENGDDVILMRLNRFPRHGITYSINYSHQLNLASGIFGPNNHGVLTQNLIVVTNDLKEVTATVGKLKVYYPGEKPTNFVDPQNTADNYSAYYYVDITFQRADINGDLDITAKDDDDYNYQVDSGHNIRHGLIINSGSTDVNGDDDGNIYEDITRTRIGNINSEGIFTSVNLTSNETGKVLRIELPVAVTGANHQTRYPYNLNSTSLTKYNLVHDTNIPTILFEDRRQKDEVDADKNDYYYLNVMDSQGNVVSPIQPENLIKDDDWGKDSDENTPTVASIEYKVSWDSTAGNAGEWVKELVLTHNQDLQGAGNAASFNLVDDNEVAWGVSAPALDDNDDSILTVSINDPDNTLLTSEVAAGNITLAYDKLGTPNNLTNWLGFEIEEYSGDNYEDAKTVTLPTGNEANPALPSFSSLSLGAITDDTGSFSVPLSWTQTGNNGNNDGLTYEVGVSTDGTNYTTLPDSGITISTGPNSNGATISGLSYGQAYTFRVRATTYEDGPYSSSVSLSAQTLQQGTGPSPSGFSLSLDTTSNSHKIIAEWEEPTGGLTYQYKLEVSTDSSYGTSDIIATITSGFSINEGTVDITIDDSDITGTFSGNTTYYLRASIRQSSDGTNFGDYGTPTSSPSPESITTVYDEITNSTAWGSDAAPQEATTYGETTIYYSNAGENDADDPSIELPSVAHSIDWGDNENPNPFANLKFKLEIAEDSDFDSDSNVKTRYTGSSVLGKGLYMAGLPDPTTGILYSNSGSGNEGFVFYNTWIEQYINAPNYYSSQNSNHITDAFNERKWFRVYVGNPNSYDNTTGEPEDADGNPYDGWGLYHEFNFLYLPGKPNNLSIPSGNITATGFDVTWDKETDSLPTTNIPSGTTYAYTYKVEYSTNQEFTSGTSEITAISHPADPVSAVTQTLSNLSGNTNYYIKVSSSNTYETDNNNNYYEYGIANNNSGNAILTKPPQVTGLSKSNITTTSVTLSWTDVGGEPFSGTTNNGYTVGRFSNSTGGTWQYADSSQQYITGTSLNISGLQPNTTYYFGVKATNASGSGAWSSYITVLTAADTIQPTYPGNTSVSWYYKKSGESTFSSVPQNSASYFVIGDTIEARFTSTDDSTVSASNASISIGGSGGNGSITESSTQDGSTTNYNVVLTYVIANGDNGSPSFGVTLTDNINGNNTITGITPHSGTTITIDTTAPTNTSNTGIGSSGTTLSLTFDEEIQVGSGGTVADGFTLTVNSNTVTGYSVDINSNDATKIDFTSISTVYQNDSVSLSYSQPGGASDIRDVAQNLLASFSNPSISNNSSQTSGGGGGSGPGDTSGPSLSGFTWYYQESGSSTTWTQISQAETLGVGDKVKLEFTATDATGCSVSTESVSVGTGLGSSSNISTNVTGDTTNGFDVTMEYEIANGDNGAISFAMTLTDGTNPTQLSSSQGTPPLGVTADTTAPAISGTPTPTWQVRTSNNPSAAKTGTMSHIALPGEKIRLYFNTDATDLSGITVTGIEFNDNGSSASNNTGYEPNNVTTNVNSGSTTGHYIEYEVDDSSNDMGFPVFKFKLEDTAGNESSVITKTGPTTLALSVQARQWLHPADNNTEFQVRLIEVDDLTQDYGEVQFDLSYNKTSDFYQLYDINKIVFNADKDISYNSTGLKRTPTWYNEFFWTIDTAKNNDYTMTDTTSNNLFDSNGDYSIKSSAFNNDDSDGKKHEGSSAATDFPGIGGGDKFIEVELHYDIDSTTAAVYRRIFEQKDSNGNLTGTSFTMQSEHLGEGDTPPTKAYTSVRSMGAAQGVNRYNNNYVNTNDNWADKEDDPYLMALHNFSQKTNANNEPIKSFKLNADYSTVSAKYKFPTYLWGSVLKGKIDDSNGWTQCEAWNGAGDWPVRRYDVSKNILEYDIKGYYIKAQENNNFDETILTYNNGTLPPGANPNIKQLIDVNDITAYSQTAKLYNDDPFIQQNGATQRKYPEMINYIHRFKMDEMNGTSDNLVKYGISGEKIDWQITPVNEHDFGKIDLASDGTGSLSWNSASEYAAHGDNVKQGYIPRLPFNDTNLENPEFINKSGGTNKSTTADEFQSTYDSSGNFDVSFDYWEEGKQLYFPSENYDVSYNSAGSIPESKSYFVNKFKFHTDISGATTAFTSSINLDMRMMSVDTGNPFLGAYNVLYIHNDTSDFATGGTNGFISSSLAVNNVSQYPNKLEVYEGITYIFDVSDPTNSAYEINFSTSTPSSVNTSYTSIGSSSITRNGDPGTSGATVTIVAPSSTMYIYDSSNNGLSTPADGFGGPLMDQLFNQGEESGGWTNMGTFSGTGSYGISSVEPVGDYRIKDISWNETYNGIMGNGDTNDISFNVTDLSNNRYYKYYYTITNTLCKTDASGVRFPQTGYNSVLTNPANPTAIFNNFENYTDNTETDVAVNAPNAYPAIPLGFFAAVPGGGVVAGAPIGIGYGTDIENMLFNVEWQYKERSYAPSSLQREVLGLSNNIAIKNMNDAEAFGYSISMSGDGKTIAVGAPYYDGRLNDNTGNEVSSTTKMGRVTVFKWRNSRWEMDHFSSGETNSDDSGFGSNNWQHGYSLSLNHNGNVLIVGAPGEHTNSAAKGRARVYLYNEVRNVWNETFNSLLTNSIPNSTTDDRYFPFDDYFNNQSANKYTECGGSVAVSANGKTIIAGGRTYQTTGIPESGGNTSIRAGHIQVAYWSDEHQRYQDKISIYFDGVTNSNPSEGPLSTNTIAANWPYEGENIRAYGPDSSGGEGASAEFGYSVAVSGDGKLFATGSRDWSGDRNYSNTSAIAFTADGNGDRTGKVALFYRAASSSLPTSSLKTNAHNGLGTSSNVNVLQGNAFADLSEDSNGRYELNKAGFNNSITDMSDNEFGYALSFNNGNRLAVSAPGEDHSNYDYKGSVYIYDCNGTATGGLGSEKVNLICKIKNHDTSNDDEYFGSGLSLSGNGNYVAIGQPYKNIGSKTDSGIVQVFKIPEPETITHVVTVQNNGSGNKYYIDGTETPNLDFVVGNTYIFDLSDTSNANGGGHPLRFSTTQDGTHGAGSEFTTEVTATYDSEGGIALGNAGANITITIQPYSPTLYYYCEYHSGMGGNSKIFLRTATQVGGDISGNDQAEFNTSDTMRDDKALFGYSVDLNNAGDVLCVGAPQYGYSQTHPPVDVSGNGYAIVFKYDSVNNKWVNVSGKYTDGGNSYTTKNQSSLYDGSSNVVVSGGNLNFTLIESSMDVEDSDSLMPFSRGRCPDYGSNIVVKSANRTDNIVDWNYSPETTITVGDFEQNDFEVDKLYFNRFVNEASDSPLTLRLSFKNTLGRIYATGPDPQDNDYNSGAGTPTPTLTMFNQFTFDISYNKGSINTPDWVDVSSNVNLNHWTTNGHVGSSVDTGDGLIYTIVGAVGNQTGTDWESIQPWKNGEGYAPGSKKDGDVELYFDDQAIKYTENNNITYWTHANSWRWNIRVSYNKGSSGNDKIVSQFNRFTNGEYDGDDTSSFEIELAQFTQQSVEIPSPIPNSLSINTLTPEIIIRDHYLTSPQITYNSGDLIPYGSQIKIEVRFPRPVYADSHHGTNFFTYLGDSSTNGSIFDNQGQSDTWNGVVSELDPVTDGAYGWEIQATVSSKWSIDSNTDTNNNSATTTPVFTPDEEIQLLANYINDKYSNPNLASSWIGWTVNFNDAFDSTDVVGDSGNSDFSDDGAGIGTYNISGNILGSDDQLTITFAYNEPHAFQTVPEITASSHFSLSGVTNNNVTISSGSDDGTGNGYALIVTVSSGATASDPDVTVSLNNSANGTFTETCEYTISFL